MAESTNFIKLRFEDGTFVWHLAIVNALREFVNMGGKWSFERF